MKLIFTVEVEVTPIEPQSIKEFEQVDGRDMIDYLSEKLQDALKGAWQYNAQVDSYRVRLK